MPRRQKSKNELKVLANISLPDYYNRYIKPLNPKFSTMSQDRNYGICPFHNDTDPSFYFWKKKNIFHCFGCGYTGDVVHTHQELRKRYSNMNLTLLDAVNALANDFGIELDKEDGFVVESIFDLARANLLRDDTYQIPRDKMTLAEFRLNNRRIARSNYPLNTKVNTFAQMDLIASIEQQEK